MIMAPQAGTQRQDDRNPNTTQKKTQSNEGEGATSTSTQSIQESEWEGTSSKSTQDGKKRKGSRKKKEARGLEGM